MVFPVTEYNEMISPNMLMGVYITPITTCYKKTKDINTIFVIRDFSLNYSHDDSHQASINRHIHNHIH